MGSQFFFQEDEHPGKDTQCRNPSPYKVWTGPFLFDLAGTLVADGLSARAGLARSTGQAYKLGIELGQYGAYTSSHRMSRGSSGEMPLLLERSAAAVNKARGRASCPLPMRCLRTPFVPQVVLLRPEPGELWNFLFPKRSMCLGPSATHGPPIEGSGPILVSAFGPRPRSFSASITRETHVERTVGPPKPSDPDLFPVGSE